MLYVEEALSQKRAENGIEEIVVGYVEDGDDSLYETDSSQIAELMEDLGDNVVQARAEDLPDDVREIYLAEMHRLKTGEYINSSEFGVIRTE